MNVLLIIFAFSTINPKVVLITVWGFFFTEKAKWRNIRKNHKRTSGIEQILKYYNITKGFM